MKRRSLVVLTILLASVVPRPTAAQPAGSVPSLRAGAAKVDITPSPGERPKSQGVLDQLYARAIVLENGGTVEPSGCRPLLTSALPE